MLIRSNRIARSLALSALLAVAIYGILVGLADIRAVWGSMARLGISGWLLLLALSLVNKGARFIRWRAYLGYLGYRGISAGRLLIYYLAGFAFTTTPGKAGEAVRSLYLKRHGVAYTHSLSAFFVERFMDVVTVLLLALTALFTFRDFQWLAILTGLSSIAFLSLIHSRALLKSLDWLIAKIKPNKIKMLVRRLRNLIVSSSDLLRCGPLYFGLALGTLAWTIEGSSLFLVLAYLGIHTSFIMALGVFSVSVLVGALSFISGGLGSTEAVMIALLGLIGVDLPTAVAATVICRLTTFWAAILIGLCAFMFLELGKEKVLGHEFPQA